MDQEGSSRTTQAAQGQDKRLEVELGTTTSDCAALDQKHLPIRDQDSSVVVGTCHR